MEGSAPITADGCTSATITAYGRPGTSPASRAARAAYALSSAYVRCSRRACTASSRARAAARPQVRWCDRWGTAARAAVRSASAAPAASGLPSAAAQSEPSTSEPSRTAMTSRSA
ncbi:hypothetical protein [Streptomyces sp. NPDC057545]|uniref:hypothetical protein n=1 Tax=Streptomyces sp. NPDC057545 TaxID=3346164 RepID=UPI00368E519C